MDDKIALLMEETGCDRREAELALEMSGFQVEEAVKAIARSLRNIAVLKGKFIHSGDQFGLFLTVANLKSGGLLRSRAVLSFNPAVYAAGLERGWFEFEKHLYGCRLWEGSLQAESLEIERRLAAHFRKRAATERLGREDERALAEEIGAVLTGLFKAPPIRLQLKREILDLRQFHALNPNPDRASVSRVAASSREEMLVLKVSLEEQEDGVPAWRLRTGDIVAAKITDGRDIAQYLAKLFGGYSPLGPVSVAVPVEAIESAPDLVLARVRFSVGVRGDATIERDRRLRVARLAEAEGGSEAMPWWKRIFK
ncbi:MAG: hypothetical protein KGK30_03615 [Elusimicrobia bacterium]|nr:hypothetical protein [Elusimicrobiota bacterium]